VENTLHTALTGQSTYEDLVKKSGLRRILFDESCLQHISFHLKSGLRRKIFTKKLLFNYLGMHFI